MKRLNILAALIDAVVLSKRTRSLKASLAGPCSISGGIRVQLVVCLALTWFSTSGPRAVFGDWYHVTELGVLPGGTGSVAYDINNSGQIVGYSIGAQGVGQHAFLYSNGSMIGLGALGGTYSVAKAINDNGQVVGSADTANGLTHAFRYNAGTMTDLGTLGGPYSAAYGINSSGQIVGDSNKTNLGDAHAFVYSAGTMSDLGTLGGSSSRAEGINASGQVVGFGTLSNTDIHAFLYAGESMTDLGTLPGSNRFYSFGSDINNSGQIVGAAYTDCCVHTFLHEGGIMSDLGTLAPPFDGTAGAGANDINNNGQIVGNSSGSIYGVSAFLYSNGTMSDLTSRLDYFSSDWVISNAYAINDSGWIVGYGTKPSEGGFSLGLLLTPVPEIPGDFNRDLVVDAADYVTWRSGIGTRFTESDYAIWRAHFGQTAGSGAAGYPLGASAASLPAVPEPASFANFAAILLAVCVISGRPNAFRSRKNQ